MIYNDQKVMEKIAVARQANKIIDGYVPGVKGKELPDMRWQAYPLTRN